LRNMDQNAIEPTPSPGPQGTITRGQWFIARGTLPGCVDARRVLLFSRSGLADDSITVNERSKELQVPTKDRKFEKSVCTINTMS
jgi:hypothetical protein